MPEEEILRRQNDIELRERLVRVEESAKRAAELSSSLSIRNEAEHKVLNEKLDAVHLLWQRQMSFIGGITVTLSALWLLILFAKDWLAGHLK
jgi:hypothetical protein